MDESVGTYVVVDSGTSNTRARLWRDGRVEATEVRPVGSRDTAAAGHNGVLKAALNDAIGELRRDAAVEAVICSGMITSNLGLREVPHLTAPTAVDDLARGMVSAHFPELCELPFFFVPGVKTLPSGQISAANLHETDLMRGEETEVTGLLSTMAVDTPAVFLHLGSHHKAIRVEGGNVIAGSSTALTGELLDAVRRHTILSGSTLETLDFEPAREMWRMGLQLVRREGAGRALFLVRTAEQLWPLDRAQATAVLLGTLAGLDLQMLEAHRERTATTVIYGKGVFGPMLNECLGEEFGKVLLVDESSSELAAVRGAVSLYARSRQLGTIA